MAAWVMAACASTAPAFADSDAAPKSAIQAVPQASNQQRGMSLPGRALSKQRLRLRPASLSRPRMETAVATFPGFRALPDGRTQVFVELSRAVAVKERHDGTTLVYTLRGTRIVVRNNSNPLITTHFSTPVDRARLVRAGEDLELVIDLRSDAGPTYEVAATEDGAARLEVTFPAGEYPMGPARRFEAPIRRERAAPPEVDDMPAAAEPAPANAAPAAPASPPASNEAPPADAPPPTPTP
jgi:hypothetical protein